MRQFALNLVRDSTKALLVGHISSLAPRADVASGAAPTVLSGRSQTLKRPRHFLDFVGLEHVANLDVLIPLNGQSALETRLHFANIVLEALE